MPTDRVFNVQTRVDPRTLVVLAKYCRHASLPVQMKAGQVVHEFLESAASNIEDKVPEIHRPSEVDEAITILRELGISTKQLAYDPNTQRMVGQKIKESMLGDVSTPPSMAPTSETARAMMEDE